MLIELCGEIGRMDSRLEDSSMTDSKKKNPSQDKSKTPPSDVQKNGKPAPDKAEGEREMDEDDED
jgi:hypothetical protein